MAMIIHSIIFHSSKHFLFGFFPMGLILQSAEHRLTSIIRYSLSHSFVLFVDKMFSIYVYVYLNIKCIRFAHIWVALLCLIIIQSASMKERKKKQLDLYISKWNISRKNTKQEVESTWVQYTFIVTFIIFKSKQTDPSCVQFFVDIEQSHNCCNDPI